MQSAETLADFRGQTDALSLELAAIDAEDRRNEALDDMAGCGFVWAVALSFPLWGIIVCFACYLVGAVWPMEWLDDDIANLRADWAAGYSTAEIGRRRGFSKNAVVGKAHRLDLPARPSPIRPADPSRPSSAEYQRQRRARQHFVRGPTLPVPPSVHGGNIPTVPLYAQTPRQRAQTKPPVAGVPRPVPAPYVAPVYGRVVDCCWPEGEPGTKTFRFCEASSVPGKPYCLDHCKTAYRPVHDRREDGERAADAAD
jgi:GcrA cell cycle regulator